jgi:hypothetical protein
VTLGEQANQSRSRTPCNTPVYAKLLLTLEDLRNAPCLLSTPEADEGGQLRRAMHRHIVLLRKDGPTAGCEADTDALPTCWPLVPGHSGTNLQLPAAC